MELEDEKDAMTERVLVATHVLFTTASNCEDPWLKDSHAYKAMAIFCNEAGQISVPSLFTTFDEWEEIWKKI